MGIMWKAGPTRRTTGTPTCPASRGCRGRRDASSRVAVSCCALSGGAVCVGIAAQPALRRRSSRTACSRADRRRPAGHDVALFRRRLPSGSCAGVELVGFRDALLEASRSKLRLQCGVARGSSAVGSQTQAQHCAARRQRWQPEQQRAFGAVRPGSPPPSSPWTR